MHELVMQAASHAIVLDRKVMPNENRWVLPTNDPAFYPLDQIDAILDAIRIATSVATGYAHIFLRPLGWAHDFEGDLPPVVEGAMVRRYPPGFDDRGWLDEPTCRFSSAECAAIAQTHALLSDAPERLKLAARRLSSATLRVDEHDAILDLCIGLEAALGDKSKNDITFKLALRVAAVMTTNSAEESPAELFDVTRKVYDFRSAVVHGDNADRSRTVQLRSGRTMTAVEAAEHLLRSCLQALLATPRTPAQIDRDLVIGALATLSGDKHREED